MAICRHRGRYYRGDSVPIEPDPYGLAYDKDQGLFVVSHNQEHFLTMLNQDDVCVRRFPIQRGVSTAVCSLTLPYTYLHKKHVRVIDFCGNGIT